MSKTFSIKPIGTVLQQADLVSARQIELALQEQTQLEKRRLGEILAQRGWLKKETADFFVEQWPTLLSQKAKQPIGQYLKQAALLGDRQIEAILAEQKQTGLRFGELVVKKGWLKQTTIDFFLSYIAPKREGNVEREETVENLSDPKLSESLTAIRQNFLDNRRCDPFRLLRLYRQILRPGNVRANNTPEQAELLNLGLIVQQGNNLTISNPIYETVFNLDWVERELARLRPFSQIRIKLFKLEDKASSPYSLLEEILAWTGEQFYLTQKLCQLISEKESFIAAGEEAFRVEQIVQNSLIENWETQATAEPLRIIRQRLLENQQCDPFRLLKLYRQIWRQGNVPADNTPEQIELLNLGLVVQQENNLRVSNPIHERVFNLAWVERELVRLHPWCDRLQLLKLEEKASSPYSVLEEILAWTGEQFYLTQKLCQLIFETDLFIASGEEAVRVEQIVQNSLIENWETQATAEPLRIIRQRLLENQQCDPFRLLKLYRQIWRQGNVPANNTPEQTELLNLGLVVKQGDSLKIANRIYKAVFDVNWLSQELDKSLRASTLAKVNHVSNKTDPVITSAPRKKRKSRSKFVGTLATRLLFGLGIAGAIVFSLKIYHYLAAKTLFQQGNDLFNQGQSKKAIAKYDKLLKLDSNYYQAWTNRGYALANLKEYEKMRESCSTATIIEPKAFYAWNCQGEALYNLKRYEEAIAVFDKAIAIDSKNPVFWINKTESLLALNQTDAASASINKAIKLLKQGEKVEGKEAIARELSVAYSHQGKVLSQKQDYEAALKAYEQALAYNLNYFAAQRGRGIALQGLKQYDEAIAQFNQMLEAPQQTNEQKAETWYYLGLTLGDLANFPEAIAAFDEALKLKPDYQAAEEAKNRMHW